MKISKIFKINSAFYKIIILVSKSRLFWNEPWNISDCADIIKKKVDANLKGKCRKEVCFNHGHSCSLFRWGFNPDP